MLFKNKKFNPKSNIKNVYIQKKLNRKLEAKKKYIQKKKAELYLFKSIKQK
jgi:hypothetical protein